MPVRIYDISKKLGLENKQVLSKAKELGIAAARVASSSLDKITAEYLEEQLRKEHPEVHAPATPPPAPAPRADSTSGTHRLGLSATGARSRTTARTASRACRTGRCAACRRTHFRRRIQVRGTAGSNRRSRDRAGSSDRDNTRPARATDCPRSASATARAESR